MDIACGNKDIEKMQYIKVATWLVNTDVVYQESFTTVITDYIMMIRTCGVRLSTNCYVSCQLA